MKLLLTAALTLQFFTMYPTATPIFADARKPVKVADKKRKPVNTPTMSKRGAFILSIKNPQLSKFFNAHYEGAERLEKDFQIPMAISLAQWFLESGFGTSKIAIERLNFGGIRRSHEYVCYETFEAFYLDYATVLSSCCYQNIDRTDLDAWTTALQWSHCKYAQSKKYKSDLNKIIKRYKLDEL